MRTRLIQRYHNLAIGHKLLFSFGLLIGLALLIVLTTILTGNLESAALHDLHQAQTNATLAAQLGRTMDQARDLQQQYFLVHVTGWNSPQTLYEAAKVNIAEAQTLLTGLAGGPPDRSPAPDIQAIHAAVSGYETAFDTLANTTIPGRGRGEDGVSASLKIAADQLHEAAVAYPDEAGLYYAARHVQQTATTYINLPSAAANQQFTAALAAFYQALDASALDPATQQHFKALAGTTQVAFNAVTFEDLRVFGEYSTLAQQRADLYALISQYIAARQAEQARALARLEAVQRHGLLIQLLVGVVLVGLGSLMAYRIGHDLTRRVNSLTHRAGQLAEGSYGERLAIDSTDEIGRLATSFNTMVAAIQQREAELLTNTHHLRQAMQQAQEASRLKDEFLAVMSHELRTPLNAIIGFQALIDLTAQLDPENRYRLERLRINAERLLGLINSILDISRIEAGQLQLHPLPTDVRDLVESVTRHLDILRDEKDLAFSVEVDSTLPATLLVDPDAVTKIITNLLSNAFKFTDAGAVHLRLWANGVNWRIEVRDTGIGIAPDMQQVIFERFRQADSSSTRRYGGTGLGLTIVQKLTEAMGGQTTLQSCPNAGSTFTVTLPLSPPPPGYN